MIALCYQTLTSAILYGIIVLLRETERWKKIQKRELRFLTDDKLSNYPINCYKRLKPQSHQIVRFVDRTIGCDLVSYDRSAMFAAISFYDRTLWFILCDWL